MCLAPGMLIAQQDLPTFRDTSDQAFDLSTYLLELNGVMVVPSVITEPAVGLGGAMGLVYFHSSFLEKSGTPSISGVAGGYTKNGTWAVGGFHAGFWKEDRIRYLGALFKTDVNVDFYGSGGLLEEPVSLNLDAWLFTQRFLFRVAESPLFLGTGYLLYQTENTFQLPITLPEFNGISLRSTLSEISVLAAIDTRDNLFSPVKGIYTEIKLSYSDKWLGGIDTYGRLSGTILGFVPLGRKISSGIRFDTRHALGGVPFWSRPSVYLRGVPAIKFQDKNCSVAEAEISYNLYRRWHLGVFSGMGFVYSDTLDPVQARSVFSMGTGFRYEIARRLGLRAGMDFARSKEDFAFYIVMGHAWAR